MKKIADGTPVEDAWTGLSTQMLVDCTHRSQRNRFGPSARNAACNGGYADATADFIQ